MNKYNTEKDVVIDLPKVLNCDFELRMPAAPGIGFVDLGGHMYARTLARPT